MNDAPPLSALARRRTWSWAALVLCVSAGASCARGERPLRSPAAPEEQTEARTDRIPASGDGRARVNATCEGCHENVAAEWRQSAHRNAATNARFVRGFSREPLAWCVGCHAPTFDTELPSRAAASLGVSCIDCHRDAEKAVGANKLEAHKQRSDAPPSAGRDGSATCAACHEFPFPADPAVAMQWTVSEHQRSSFAQTDCSACHMPAPPGARPHRDHRFEVSDAMIRQSSSVEVSRTANGISFRFRQGRVGHAFPTGDTFRRIRIEAETVDARSRVVEKAVRLLSRRMPKAGPEGRSHAEDDRLFLAGPLDRVELAFKRPGNLIRYRIAYERAESERPGDDAQQDAVELAHGSLPQLRRP